MSPSTFLKVWSLFDQRERRNALIVLVIMGLSALATASMVGSIFPFLSVLSDPNLIDQNQFFNWAYVAGGFERDFDFVLALGFGAIIVVLLSTMMLLVNTWAVTRFTQMRMHSISQRLLSHYLSQPYEFFLSRHSGQMSTNILSEAERLVRDFIYPSMTLISSLLTVIAVVGMLMIADPIVATSALALFGSIYGATIYFTRRLVKQMGRRRAAANELRFKIAGEALSGIKDVKLLGREASYLDRYSQPSLETARTQERVAIIAQAPRFVIQMVGFGGMILLALVLLDPAEFGQRDALAGLLPLLGLLAFAGQRLLPELQSVYFSLTALNAGTAALDRVYSDLKYGEGCDLDRKVYPPLRLNNDIVLKSVSYSYPGKRNVGIEQIQLRIRAGERVGVIGTSGAGKTTLADVMLGLLEPQSGQILIDGEELDRENLRSWQKSIGYVPQEIFLTDASLAENIALGIGRREIDQHRIEAAARSALLHDFVVQELPEGYDTHIGERGVRLSGGQRQRIGIARALYQDADLILFDEATSALDNLTEAEVMTALQALPGDKTAIIIAHRLSTVRHCSRIIILDRGRKVGEGSWQELEATNSIFQALITEVH